MHAPMHLFFEDIVSNFSETNVDVLEPVSSALLVDCTIYMNGRFVGKTILQMES